MEEPLDSWFKREILMHEEILMRFLARVWRRRDEMADIRQEAYARVYEAAQKSPKGIPICHRQASHGGPGPPRTLRQLSTRRILC